MATKADFAAARRYRAQTEGEWKRFDDAQNSLYAAKGTFSSQTGGYGGPGSVRPGREPLAAVAAAVPSGPPKPLSGLEGQGVAPDVKLASGALMSGRQNAIQAAAQDEFDRKMGFTPTARTPAPGMIAKPAAPAVAPTPPTGKGPLEAFTDVGSLGGPVPSSDTAYLGLPGTNVGRVIPGPAQSVGLAVRRGIGNVVDPAVTAVQRAGAAEGQLERNVGGALKSFAQRAIAQPIASAASAVGGFTSGLLGRGAATPAGVSNATAAQFEAPTKEKPLPTTPTSPVANIDRSDNAIGKFGLSDDEFNQKKVAFAGF